MLKHRKQLEELETEKNQVEKEISSVEDAIAVIQNEQQFLQSRFENVKKENKVLEENIALARQIESHQDQLIKSLQAKQKEEQDK